MAVASAASTFTVPVVGAMCQANCGAKRRRRISPEAGRALEILGHAIEYLTDEYIYRGGSFSARDDEVEAIQTLMGINRQIYFACPEVPTMAERWRSLLRFHAA